jgi:AraC-like DNA-binding protein
MPTRGQWARTPPGLPDVVLCNGPAEHYRDNVQDVLKLVLVPAAEFGLQRGRTRHTAGPGQLIVLHPGEAHSGGPTRAQQAEWLLLCLPRRRFDEGELRWRMSFRDPMVESIRLARWYQRLHRMLEHPLPALRRESALVAFTAALSRHADQPVSPPAWDGGAGARTAYDYLAAHLDRNVTLTEVAEVSGLSPYHLARTFTLRFGLPPHRLHMRLRLDRSLELLRRGRRPVEVAFAAGFSDQAHLTRVFRQAYGITPGEYRELRRRPRPKP